MFLEISHHDRRFIMHKNYVDTLVNFDLWFNALTVIFEKLFEDFCGMFKKARLQPVVYSIVDKNFNKIKCKMLPYRVFCHLFHYV